MGQLNNSLLNVTTKRQFVKLDNKTTKQQFVKWDN